MEANAVSESYGHSLPDQVERISDLIDAHLELVSDLREFYKERSALDREYAVKLQALVKKAADKKARMEAHLIMGKDPTKAWHQNDLKANTLGTAYTEIITSTTNMALDHVALSDAIQIQAVEKLKSLEQKQQDTKKQEMAFFQKLLSEKDRRNNDRQKNKTKYDDECREVDALRQKQGRSQDDRHAGRVAKQTEQQRVEMLNCKNQYIISTVVANGVKNKFYAEDVPELEDTLQVQQTKLMVDLVDVLINAQQIESAHLDSLKGRLSTVEAALHTVDPKTDQSIFIDFNIRPFNIPQDWKFDPCQNFYDTDEINVEPAPKVVLQNALRRCQTKLQELTSLLENKRKEYEQLKATQDPVRADDNVLSKMVEARHQISEFSTSECILKTEIDTILSALGDDLGEQSPHSFKGSSFSIPTTCGYCHTSIWGLTKQGKTCKACGISVHGKCEMKVPANCQISDQPSSLKPSATVSRLDTSQLKTPTASSFVQHAAEEEPSYPLARLLFDFESTSEFELSVSAGSSVRVLEHDDGSGWVKVLDNGGEDGLVPASYLQYEDGDDPAAEQSTRVRALYDYAARTGDEIGLQEGEMIELTDGPNGGRNYADGWWEGINSRGERGIFPSNYVEVV